MSVWTAVFLTAGTPQRENAASVAAHLPAPSRMLDMATATWVDGSDATHLPAVRWSRLIELSARVEEAIPHAGTGALVVGQDCGWIERGVIAACMRRGVPVVLMPDGVVGTDRVTPPGARSLALDLADAVGRRTGILAGRRAWMGRSRVDLCLSWGPGWDPVWRRTGGPQRTIDTGQPRSDTLLDLEGPSGDGNVLLISQPLYHPVYGGSRTAKRWYRFLRGLIDGAGENVRLRLHPAERGHDSSRVPSELRQRTSTRPLRDDLAWADVVAGPESTVLVEAVGMDRPIVHMEVCAATAHWSSRCPFFADYRVPAVSLDAVRSVGELVERTLDASVRAALRGDYLTNIGHAAERAAREIDSLMRSSSSRVDGQRTRRWRTR